MKRTITDFFGQQSKRKSTAQPERGVTPTEINVAPEQQATTSTALLPTRNGSVSESSSYDVGTIEWSKLSSKEKVSFLPEPWCPPLRFKWPYIQVEHKERGNARQKYLGRQHFTGKFDVFSYLLSKGRIFFHPCPIFAPDEVRGVTLEK